MSNTNQPAIFTIIAAITILLFLGILFLVMVLYYQKRKRRFHHEKQLLEAQYNQQLLQTQLEIQEQTFNIISQEIHDNVGQALSLAKMQLNILERGDTLNKDLVSDTRDSISKAMADLRDIAKSLNTERIQQLKLSEVVGYELSRINRAGFIHTNMDVQGEEQSVQSQKKLIIFRMIQEALQNILKHSKTSTINILFHYQPECLKIEVRDNGKGFDTGMQMEKDGLGLQNIISRAALIGGEAHIESKLKEGTTVTIITPYL